MSRVVVIPCTSWNGRHRWPPVHLDRRCSTCGIDWYRATANGNQLIRRAAREKRDAG